MQPDWEGPLGEAYARAMTYLQGLPVRRVGASVTADELRARLGGPLPHQPANPVDVVTDLAEGVEGGLVATGSGRFFGFVIGGATPASLAADWLATVWDQNAGLYAAAPAAAMVEEIAAGWLVELFGLPKQTSVGFVTGGQMANFTALAAARHAVLRNAGWDVEVDGLVGAPPIRVLVGAERHDTVDRALRFLGLGTRCIVPIAVDGQGRMRPDALASELGHGPTIICAQAGNVNTGAIDPLDEICALSGDAWVHVDGAFGLWSALTQPIPGLAEADSWATDAHKWLNVPYDSGLVFCAHPEAHQAAMAVRAAYLIHDTEKRDPLDYNPEFSRRARGFAVYAAIRALGRSGITELVDRCQAMARRFAEQLEPYVLNEVRLNQVLVSFGPETPQIVQSIQEEGTAWMSGTTWQGKPAMRISVSNWTTTAADVDRSVEIVRRCVENRRARSTQG
ncbi:aspartate aminotransferase family protein [Kribbella sandramycini]|uniref:Aspartate aminotransferase family protein n=1 Tax=Kribbella sandramycini TaxID=60450 RepID=A0A7Y4L6X7_9ACTN|nr:pyridoxal-dependent decarboxylase [Kribbella sandramycini]MBB6566717.1 glutamate/tyrosine decarboxylase-like PLP-dependent enzyme [Kribbella sandramycini]NOL45503.1 aspartate aminotransferase family protein [Kribbella sandramycini]